MNALQLLEFNLKLEKVHADHRASLDALKQYWNVLRRSGRELKPDPEHIIQQACASSRALILFVPGVGMGQIGSQMPTWTSGHRSLICDCPWSGHL